MRARFRILLGLCPLLLAAAALAAEPTLRRGEIGGAPFVAAEPEAWNRHLLLIAPGYRSPEASREPVLRIGEWSWLLEKGWIVAATSYRRNGLLLADGMEDLRALRDHLARERGEPERTVLLGQSMGGAIVTLLAEQYSQDYDGALAIGAALDLRDPAAPELGFTMTPRIPLLFLANRTEIAGPRAYCAAPFPRDRRPVLFRVERDGHVNVNPREVRFALEALLGWIETGPLTLPNDPCTPGEYDATQAPEATATRLLFSSDGTARARVTAIEEPYGNVRLDAQPADFEKLGLRIGDAFDLTVHGQTFSVLYGRDFSSVGRGQWVAFAGADGFLVLARNFDNAAASASLHPGDELTLRPKAAGPKR